MAEGTAGTPIDRTAFRVALLATSAAVLAVLLVAALLDIRRAASDRAAAATAAAPRIEQALRTDPGRALEGIDVVSSAKLHGEDGKIVAEANGSAAATAGMAESVATSIAPGEIVCGAATGGGMLCIEQANAPVAERVGFWLRTLAIGTIAALLLGALAGYLISRAVAGRSVALGTVVDRAVRDRDYSQRVAGTATGLGASLNALLEQFQQRELALQRRTTDLEVANKELEAFSYAVSHDLRGPLGSVEGFAQALEDDPGDLSDNGRECVHWIKEGCERMRELIDGLLEMTRLARAEMEYAEVDMTALAKSVAEMLRQKSPNRSVRFDIHEGAKTMGDARLLRNVLENLMGNAFKFTRDRDPGVVEFGVTRNGGEPAFYVRDNGAGFDPSHAAKMFRPFQRLHSSREFEGTGIGLATVQKIVMRHGGKAWAEGDVGKGATIYFTTGAA